MLDQWVIDMLRRLPKIEGTDLIWPYPHGLEQLRRRYTKDILKPAGLPTSAKHKFHCLRRTSVTQVSILHGPQQAQSHARHFGAGLTIEKYISQTVVEQQTGSVSFSVPRPAKTADRQRRLFPS
jgi:hypothetical protein